MSLIANEGFRDAVYVTTTSTGVAASGLTLVCTVIRLDTGATTTPTVAEVGATGVYQATNWTPAADANYVTVWTCATSGKTIYGLAKVFKVGGGQGAALIADIGDFSGQTNLQTLLAALGIPDVAGKPLYTCLITDRLDNATYGLSAIETLVDGIEARTNNHLNTRIWYSLPQLSATVANAAGDVALPSVTLPNIGGTIVAAYAGFRFRAVQNTNGAGNKLNGAQEIQVKENAAGAWTDAINLVDDLFTLGATTKEVGECTINGIIDVVGQVAAFNKTYDFQIDQATADADNLVFHDVQTFLVVSYY